MIEITVDTHIRIPRLTPEWKNGLAELVSVKNESKDRAERELIWGAENMPDKLSLARVGTKNLILPRGFLSDLEVLLQDQDLDYTIHDKTQFFSGLVLNPVETLRDDQKDAVEQILSSCQGRIIAPPGKGKTVTALATVSELRCPTLIIVEKLHIAKQWQERAKEHIGIDIGLIGDNEWIEKPISVATIQTLWSRREELSQQKWWKYWSMVILDEQHHIPARTFLYVVQKFPAKYRIGLSATKGKSKEKAKISELVFGPTLYEDSEVPLKPEIHTVETSFSFDYHPTRRIRGKVLRNNYQKMVTALIRCSDRNEQIAERIVKNKDNCNLILSRRLDHLDALYNLCINKGFDISKCYMLTGNESSEERMEIYNLASSGRCAIFSTVADEAVDIPRIDRIYLAFPAKNVETIWQQIGRGTRPHPDKSGTIIYDFVDKNVTVLYNQYKHRLRGLYQKKELPVSESNIG